MVCADCGSKLVDEKRLKELAAERQTDEKAYELNRQLKENGEDWSFEDAEIRQDQFAEMGKKYACAETGEDINQSEGSADAENASKYAGSLMYRDSSERASETRSSAWCLLGIGGLGLIIIILGIIGVIPLTFSNSYLTYGVMAAVFILFLVSGIVSMKNAKIFAKKAESENSLKNTMLEWCKENLRAEDLDRHINAEEIDAEEVLYLKRTAGIQARLNHQFVNLDQGFLEKFIEDYVYDVIFGKGE